MQRSGMRGVVGTEGREVGKASPSQSQPGNSCRIGDVALTSAPRIVRSADGATKSGKSEAGLRSWIQLSTVSRTNAYCAQIDTYLHREMSRAGMPFRVTPWWMNTRSQARPLRLRISESFGRRPFSCPIHDVGTVVSARDESWRLPHAPSIAAVLTTDGHRRHQIPGVPSRPAGGRERHCSTLSAIHPASRP